MSIGQQYSKYSLRDSFEAGLQARMFIIIHKVCTCFCTALCCVYAQIKWPTPLPKVLIITNWAVTFVLIPGKNATINIILL